VTLSRRSFFTKLAGSAVAARIAPFASASLLRATGGVQAGGFAHFGQGTLVTLHGPEYIIPLARATDELLKASTVDVAAFIGKAMPDDL
jgi:hypothetical protein